jgi:hypothetical protein
MMRIPRPAAVLLALALGACTDARKPADAPPPAGAAQTAVAHPADSAPRVAAATTPSAQRDTMLTSWSMLEMPSEPWIQENATPEALLRQVRDIVAAQLEEPDAGVLPTRMESQTADSAVGFLMHPNLADDSIRDIEFRIHMRREGSVWRVSSVDRRERCRRGVSDGGRCA